MLDFYKTEDVELCWVEIRCTITIGRCVYYRAFSQAVYCALWTWMLFTAFSLFFYHILSGDGFLLSWGRKAGTKLTEFCFFGSDLHPEFLFELGQEKIKFLPFPHPAGKCFPSVKNLGT